MTEQSLSTKPPTDLTSDGDPSSVVESVVEATKLIDLATSPDNPNYLVDRTAQANCDSLVTEWTNRASALHASPEQTPQTTSDGLGFRYQKISLYHGGPTAGITEFEAAEDDTIGNGLYATSMPDQAFGYAIERADKRQKRGDTVIVTGSNPVVYEFEVSDASFLDIRDDGNLRIVLGGYAQFLKDWVARAKQGSGEGLNWLQQSYPRIVADKVKEIEEAAVANEYLHPKKVLQQTGKLFTDYVRSLGYDGVIATEGGEGGYTGTHDSWVIMDPASARVTNEVTFQSPYVVDQDVLDAQRTTNRSTWWQEDS